MIRPWLDMIIISSPSHPSSPPPLYDIYFLMQRLLKQCNVTLDIYALPLCLVTDPQECGGGGEEGASLPRRPYSPGPLKAIPANSSHLSNAVSMLGQRRRHSKSIGCLLGWETILRGWEIFSNPPPRFAAPPVSRPIHALDPLLMFV